MPDNIVINIPDYGSYSQEELQQEYGENWLKAVDQLKGTVDIPDYGSYSYSDLKDAYGDDIPKALSQLSSKKKDQEEVSSEELPQEETPQMEVQEDMESVSEDGSLDSQSEETDVPLEFPKQRTEAELAFKSSKGYYPDEIEIGEKKKDKVAEDTEKEWYEDAVSRADALGKDFDYLSGTTEEISEMFDSEADDNSVFQVIEQKKNDLLNKQGKEYFNKMLSDSSKAYLDRGDASVMEEAEDFVKRDYLKSMRNMGINSLGLDSDKIDEAKPKLDEYYQLRQIPFEKRTPEQNAKVSELKDYVSKFREDSEKFFIDQNTGKIDGEKRKLVNDLEAKYVKEAKTDFQKFSSRYKQEYDNINSIKGYLYEQYKDSNPGFFKNRDKNNLTDNDVFWLDWVIEDSKPNIITDAFGETSEEDYKKYNKTQSLLKEYEKSELNFNALSRALLLNENPSAVAKGWGEFFNAEDSEFNIPFLDKIGEGITSFGESFVEAIPGVGNVGTDRDFKKDIVRIANEEGVTLTEEQYDSAVDNMTERVGDTFGTSAEIMAEIIVTTLLTKNASSAVNLAGKVGRLVNSLGGGKKAASIAGEGLKALEQAIAFDLTSQGSAAMGMGEFLGAKGADKVLNLLSKGKSAKFMKFMKPLTRVMGATTAGAVEEYGGEYLEQGFKNGFISKETFRNTFGRNYDEAKDKLLMTLILTGTFGTGAEVANMYKLGKDYYKDSGDQTQLNDVEKAFNEIQNTKKEKVLTKFDDMSEAELKKYAEDNNVDISELEKTIEAAKKPEEGQALEDVSEEDLDVLTAEKEKITEQDLEVEDTENTEVEPGDIAAKSEEVVETEQEPITDTTSEEDVVAEGDTFTQEELLEEKITEEQSKVNNISKAINKIAPDVEFVFHKTQESYNNSSDKDVSSSRGYRNENKVHIDLTSVRSNTTFHEAIHPVLDAVFEKNPETYNSLVESMKSDPEFKSYFEKAKKEYEGENTQVNEALTEMMSDVAAGKYFEDSTVFQKVKDFIKQILTKLNLRASDFNIDLSKEVDVRQFADNIGKALAQGKEITFEKETKLFQDKISDSIKKGLNATKALSSVITESSDNLYEDVNGSKEITKEGVKKANEKANKNVDEFYDKVKNQISEKALNVYETINKTSKITRDGFLKASIKSKEFLKELSRNLDIASQKIYDSYKKSINYLKAASIGAGMILAADQAVIPSIEGYSKMGTEGAVYEVIKSNKWAVDALEGTEVGNTLKSALGRLEFKYGDVVGGESVTIKEANEGSEVVKSVEDIFPEDNVSPEVRKFIAKNTTFKISDKKIPLYRSGKRVGETAHIQNQFPADSGFIYFASPTVGSVKNKPFSADGSAVAQFQLDGSVSDEQTYEGDESDYTKGVPGHYMHKNNDAILKVAKQRNDYVPVFEKLGDNKVRVKYKRFNELEKGERIMSPLRQFKFSDIAWGQETQASDFAKGMKALPLKKGVKYPYPGKKGGNQTDIIFGSTYKNPKTGKISKGSDRYGLYEGIGAVFIFKDNNNITWVREFNGSANQVAAKGREIIKQFNIKPEDLTVGYHDVGSYSARPLAKKGKVSTDSYTGKNEYNKKDETGGALYYPPKGVNFQKKKKSSKSVKATINKSTGVTKKSAEVVIKERKLLIEQIKNKAKGAKSAVKSVKENQNKFNESVKEADSYLSEDQRNTVRNLGSKVIDSKSLISALNKLANILQYNAANPSVKTKIQATTGVKKTKQKQVTIPETELNKKLLKAEEAAVKNLSKGRKRLVKEVFSKIKTNVKNISKSDLRKLLTLSQNVDTSNPVNVLEFEDQVNQAIEKAETIKKKQEVSNLKTKLKNALKRARKKEGNKLGQRGILAKAFADVNVNDITDLDAFSKAAEKMIDSLSKVGTSFSEVNKIASELIDAAEKNKQTKKEERTDRLNKALEEDLNPSEFAILKDSYENSGLSEEIPLYKFAALKEQFEKSPFSKSKKYSIKEYYELSNAIRNKTLDKAKEAKLQEIEEQNRKWLQDRLTELKDKFNSITATMTPRQKAIVKDLINSKDILSREDMVGAETLMSLHQSLDEIMSFNSVAGVNKAATLLDSIKKIKLAQLKLKDAIFSNVYDGARLAPNLSSWLKAITKGSPSAKKLNSLLFGNYESSWSEATTKNNEFKTRLSSLARELKLDLDSNHSIKMGVISFLKQNDFNLTEEQKQQDLVNRLTSIKNQVNNLRKQKSGVIVGSKNKRQADAIEKAFKDLGIDLNSDFKKTDLTKSNLENRLSENERKMLNFLENEFLAIRSDMNESYLMAKGEDLNLLENYLPTFATKLDKKENTEEFKNNSIKATLSGRTIERTRIDQTGKTIYNFDVFGTSSAGYMDSMNDIHTLYDRTVLENIMQSKPLEDLFAGKEQVNKNLYNEALRRVSTLLDKRNSNYANNIAKTTKLQRSMKGSFNAFVAMPLRGTEQWIKQPISIIANSVIRTPKESTQSFGIIMKATTSRLSEDKAYYENFKKLMNSFNSKLRVAEGDVGLSDAQGFGEKALKIFLRKIEAGENVDSFLSKFGAGSLKAADKIASQGSQLAEFISARKKQEGKGYKFDLAKEVENLGSKKTKEAISDSNISSDWINNASDITTDSGNWNSKLAKFIKNTLFLFKGFAINQTYNNYIDARNVAGAFKDISTAKTKEQKKKAIERLKKDSKMLTGSMVSNFAFLAASQFMIRPLLDEVTEALMGVEDPDDEKEVGSVTKKELGLLGIQSLFDSFFGGFPDDVTFFAKKIINDRLVESAKKEREENKAFRKELNISDSEFPEESVKDYLNKAFYEPDGVSPPGLLGVLYGQAEDIARDVSILAGEETYKESFFGEDVEVPLDKKTAAFMNIVWTLLHQADGAKMTKKAIVNEIKNKKKEYNEREFQIK